MLDYAKLAPHQFVFYDTETWYGEEGSLAPPLVCASFAMTHDGRLQTLLLGGTDEGKRQAFDLYRRWLADHSLIICGANIAFDNLVMIMYGFSIGVDIVAEVFEAYARCRFYDLQIAEKLNAIARGILGIDPWTGRKMTDPVTGKQGDYSLSICLYIRLNRRDAKVNDTWRKRYKELDGIPIEQWESSARIYPIDDVRNTAETCLAQLGFIPAETAHELDDGVCRRCGMTGEAMIAMGVQNAAVCTGIAPLMNLHDLSNQVESHWGLWLGAHHGFFVDIPSVLKLQASVEFANPDGTLTPRGEERKRFQLLGLIRLDGSEDQSRKKRMIVEAYGAKDKCKVCNGEGRVWVKDNPKHWSKRDPTKRIGAGITCDECSGTTYDLTGLVIPLTDSEGVAGGRDVLTESGNDVLMDYGDYKSLDKVESTYLKFLRRGLDWKADPIPLTLRPNVIVDTGRTSYYDATQTLPRKGLVRPCIRARPGHILSSTDAEAGELVTHAQNCLYHLGYSRLAEALNRGVKPHNDFAAYILKMPYDEFNKRYKAGDKKCIDTRQAAKPPNFGFPGRMGAAKLAIQQRKIGPDTECEWGPSILDNGKRGYKGLRFCILMGAGSGRCGEVKITEWNRRPCEPVCKACVECCQFLRNQWIQKWPENDDYFELVKEYEDNGRPMIQHVSGRIRFTSEGNAIANGFFQGLLADAIKAAQRQVTRECYLRHLNSPLYGSHMIAFQHDEMVCEHPEEMAHVAAPRVSQIMVGAMQAYCPDLAPACRAEPALMLQLYKGAEALTLLPNGKIKQGYHPQEGKLIPWEPDMKLAA